MSRFPRIDRICQEYVMNKPRISTERARIWTESHRRTEGQPVALRRAQAFYDTCAELKPTIFSDELIVGASGEFRKCGILTPEFSWLWVDKEMDRFSSRPQDPYLMEREQIRFMREAVFPYWSGQSLEEAFLSRINADTKRVGVDTGFIDSDSKWRQAVGEITPDYQDVLFKKGFTGILKDIEANLNTLEPTSPEAIEKIEFYRAVKLTSQGIILLAKRYAEQAQTMAEMESDVNRKQELIEIARVCNKVPAEPPQSFQEALQFMWFVQLGGILSENPLALNPGRFDQFMLPYYQYDKAAGKSDDDIQEMLECLWLKYSEWVWTISANTADFFAGYNQFQNLTVGGRDRYGNDATNALSYMCLKATEDALTHQPGLSVKIHQNAPQEFIQAVTHLVSKGTGFPAIHSDEMGYQMLINNGLSPADAMEWSNCGCVVPHSRKVGEWTSAVNVNLSAALEFALNEGKSRLSGSLITFEEKPLSHFASYEEVEEAFIKQFDYLIKHSAISILQAQKLHSEMVPRPFLSSCIEQCLIDGVDLSKGGAKYNVGPVFTGIGLSVTANSLAVIKKLVFEEKKTTLRELSAALCANWEGYEKLRQLAIQVPKYGNDDDYVDAIAKRIAYHFYQETHTYKDFYGNDFNSAFMGISNYLPGGKVLGATPDGRKAREPISEGVSPYVGTDQSTPLAALKSAAKMNHDLHSGGTLLNLRLDSSLIDSKRGQANLGAMVKSFFALGGFHVQFNTLSNEILLEAQQKPENYRNLLVRVAGYSTQFVNLSPSMQDSIIARNAHDHF